jgi:hypothetical protein
MHGKRSGMLIVSYIDGESFDSRQEEVVAKSWNSEIFYTLSGVTLRAVPERACMTKIYTEGLQLAEVPNVVDWIESHVDEVSGADFSLVEAFEARRLH